MSSATRYNEAWTQWERCLHLSSLTWIGLPTEICRVGCKGCVRHMNWTPQKAIFPWATGQLSQLGA